MVQNDQAAIAVVETSEKTATPTTGLDGKIYPVRSPAKRARNKPKPTGDTTLAAGLTDKQLRKSAQRFIECNEITLDSMVFALEAIDPAHVDYVVNQDRVDKMIADVGKVRQFLNQVAQQRGRKE